MQPKHFDNGVSVVIPMYRAERYVHRLVEMLGRQTLDRELFEVIFIVNGPPDGTAEKLRNQVAGAFAMKVASVSVSSAGAARNVGISIARKRFITFLDADDLIESEYLSAMLEKAQEDTIVVAPMLDCDDQGRKTDSNYTTRHQALAGMKLKLNEAGWVLGFNSCKLIPSRYAKRLRYSTALKSGEDVVFHAGLLRFTELYVVFLKPGRGVYYLRQLTQDSVSRQKDSFDFCVTQRVECIKAIEEMPVSSENQTVRDSLLKAQLGFVERYWEKKPQERSRVENFLRERHVPHVDWPRFNKGRARGLVFSYCFPPYADASGTIVAKRMLSNKQVVDVISAKMDAVRTVDPVFFKHIEPWIQAHHSLAVPVSFASLTAISEFALQANKKAAANLKQKYDYIYSRAMWAGSHLAALLYKLDHPETAWIAEFSDPMTRDAEGNRRASEAVSGAFAEELWGRCFPNHDVPMPENVFEFIETATFQIADRLIFTNRFQKDLMLSTVGPSISNLVEKVEISPHPSPEPFLYGVAEPKYELDPFYTNIGYFGNFYPNRGLGELLQVLYNNRSLGLEKLRFHVFTSDPQKARDELPAELQGLVEFNKSLDYLSFLALSKKFDALLVTDAETKGKFDRNPFLPSKYSDYRGSGVPIWGHVENGSILSEQKLRWMSYIGNPASVRDVAMAMGLGKG